MITIVLHIVVAFLQFSECSENGISWIQSPRITEWGTWGPQDVCPDGTYVKGIKVSSQPYQGKWNDDTALNGVVLQCIALETHPSLQVQQTSITSSMGSRGKNSRTDYCESGVATGFQMRVEPWQRQGDDTATNDVKLVCANKRGIYKTSELSFTTWGDWSQERKCPIGTAVCGIRTQVDMTGSGGSDDVTGLNSMDMRCCDLPNPATNCNATDYWMMIIKRDNAAGNSPMRYKLREKVGASHTVTEYEGGSVIEEISQSVGFGIGVELLKYLGLNFEYNIGYSSRTEYHWSVEKVTTWSYEREEETELIIPPHCVTTLYQAVGKCGPYRIKANFIKREDVCPNGNETFHYDNWFTESTATHVRSSQWINILVIIWVHFR